MAGIVSAIRAIEAFARETPGPRPGDPQIMQVARLNRLARQLRRSHEDVWPEAVAAVAWRQGVRVDPNASPYIALVRAVWPATPRGTDLALARGLEYVRSARAGQTVRLLEAAGGVERIRRARTTDAEAAQRSSPPARAGPASPPARTRGSTTRAAPSDARGGARNVGSSPPSRS